ncbi:GNAT family N-acetyltransferase [Flexivirga meconopsidis]|uniref:GNAT family N-acetyltransferase n=1 Tax=Flexivirga meconopsidis TaxID=2977121 RepID=UPI00223F8EC3
MDPLRIVPVDGRSDDPAARDLFDRWVDAQRASMASLHTGTDPSWSASELRTMRRTRTDIGYADRVALRGHTVVGMLAIAMPLHDNQDNALVMLHVPPEHRGGGVGSALADEAESIARQAHRTILQAFTEYDAGSDDIGRSFAERRGFAVVQTMLGSTMALPGDRDLLGRATAAARREDAAAYELEVSWDGIPEDWLAGRAELSRRMSTDAPQGDLSWDEEEWTPQRVADDLQRVVDSGRRFVEVVARDGRSGRLAGFTRLEVSTQTPERAYQQDTLVLREARGHSLGLRMKATAALAMMDELPAVSEIRTWNAADNEPMLAVNARLGYRPDGIQRVWQRRLAPERGAAPTG